MSLPIPTPIIYESVLFYLPHSKNVNRRMLAHLKTSYGTEKSQII